MKTGNNLRDHMTDLELIFTMLGEAGTTEIARRKDAQGFADNRKAAKEGGAVAGNARKALEAKSGKPVVSKKNYLTPPIAAALADTAAPHLNARLPLVRRKRMENKMQEVTGASGAVISDRQSWRAIWPLHCRHEEYAEDRRSFASNGFHAR